MQYLLLIYSTEDAGPQPGDDDFGAYINEYMTLTQEMQENGAYKTGQALESASTATSVRVLDGQSIVSDGPFAETKEVLGGFYLLNCKNLDEALAYAAKIPTAKHGTIEVRPIMDIPEA